MKIAIAYIVVTSGRITLEFVSRFVASYHQFPPGQDHDTIIICNGGPVSNTIGSAFASMPCTFFPRPNQGWDIAGYIEAAKKPAKDYDLLLCLGESVYFHRAGWLKRIVECWKQYGPGMYGLFSSNVIRPHLQTTAFATAPHLLAAYPITIKDRETRYQFEHGPYSFWRWLAFSQKQTRLVTWDGCWPPAEWRMPSNILWRGDQSNCLAWCNHSDNWLKMDLPVKRSWGQFADQAA